MEYNKEALGQFFDLENECIFLSGYNLKQSINLFDGFL